MEKLGRIAAVLFVFVLLPAGVLASLVLTLVMPSAATQATWFGFTVCGAIVVALGLTNVVARSGNRLFGKVPFSLAATGLSFSSLTGVFCHFGI